MKIIIVVAIRAFEDEAKARLGVVECAKHELLQPFSVLHEKEGECFTSLLVSYSLCIFILNIIYSMTIVHLFYS